jgi:hypothetical protein
MEAAAMNGHLDALVRDAPSFDRELTAIKHGLAPANSWYPYGALSNMSHLDRLLSPGHRDLADLAGHKPILDIGAADGDMSFYLASHGFEVDILDWGPTNFNGLNGARLLASHLSLPVSIYEVDLDGQFSVPRERYGLVLFLGTLYHLQNPFFALRKLSAHADYLLMSTRIAAVTTDRQTVLRDLPIAYLVDPDELNNDPTNYWVFSIAGLRRLVTRAGWVVEDEISLGTTDGTSDPSSMAHDERAFMLLRNQNLS